MNNKMTRILIKISIALILASLFACKPQKVLTERSFTEVNPIQVAPQTFNLPTSEIGVPIFISKIDTVTKDSIQIRYIVKNDGSIDAEVDCPDFEETITTLERELDLSYKSQKRIEEKAEKRADKEIKKAYKDAFKEGVKEGKSKGRKQILWIFAIAGVGVLAFKFKSKIPFI